MARYRKKKALYELISKSKRRASLDRSAEKARSEESAKDEAAAEKSAVEMPDWVSKWRRKPSVVQFIAGRIEFSIPYPLAVAVVLGVVVLVLVAYRIGEYSSRVEQELTPKSPSMVGEDKGTTPLPKGREPESTTVGPKKPDEALKTKGDHRIVIKQYDKSRDLEQVQRYFLAHGIETVIEGRAGQYFLLTKDTYQNPKRAGTDGAAALNIIKQIGSGYKAPQGYESFARRLFSDAYGERIKK